MKQYYQKSWTKVVELLGSNVYKGLIEYDCILRRECYGDNKVTIPNKKSVKCSLLDKVFSWTSLIYLAVVILFIIKKKYIFLSIELAVYILGLVHTAWYSWKNKKNVEFLSKLKKSPEEVAQKLKMASSKYGDLAIQDKIDDIQFKFRSLKQKAFIHRRLINAFPNMRSSGNKKRDAHFQYIKKMLREKNK